MKHLPLISSICSTPRHKLYMAIAAQILASAGAQAAPNGGTIVGGDAVIEQLGVDTTITQTTNRLAIDWESFNIAAEERVQFIQPDSSSVALNRILGNEASQIFGRLDANGHVILMNPNGVLFGEGATVNVGGLVASGLNINADDFMNGEFIFQAVEGTGGAVINNGIINAATGGNVALLGKQIDNQGLISAKLGSVSLAAGKEAVLTFDNQGMLGVRVSKEVLQSELGIEAAVTNSGEITAEGGRILMTGSVSQDIFSQAVNADGLKAKASVVMHEDGSFTLGGGADVVNTGTISTSSESTEAGQIVVLGENVNTSGAILANSKTGNASGNIEIHARDTTLLTEQSQTSATNDGAGSGGQIKILGDRVGILDQSQIDTSGTTGGGDINIGGGFQGKETQLRNATRTVVGKDILIEANAISEGDGGDVIVWADETTSFTGEINVRGGELGGDGGFVEVSGKENLKFDGRVDRSAPNGKAGELLLDPEEIIIVSGLGQQDDELDDTQILGSDGPGLIFTISTAAIEAALTAGDVSLSAERLIGLNESDEIRIVAQAGNTNNLYFGLSTQSGRLDFSSGAFIDLGLGDLRISAYTGATLSGNYYANNIDIQTQGTSFHDVVFAAQGDFTMLGASSITSSEGFRNTISARNLFVRPRTTGGTAGSLNNVSLTAFSASIEASEVTLLDAYIEDSFEFIGTGTRYPGFSVRGDNYVGGNLNVQTGDLTFYEDSRLEVGARTDISAGWVAEFQRNSALFSRDNIALSGSAVQYDIEENATINSDGIVDLGSQNIAFNGGQIQAAGGVTSTASIIQSANIVGDFTWNGADINLFGNNTITGEVNIVASEGLVLGQPTVEGDITSIVVNGSFSANADSFVFADGVVINTSDSVDIANGDIKLTSQQDMVLPTIISGGDLNIESSQGSVVFGESISVAGETNIVAEDNVSFLETSIFLPGDNVYLIAGNDISFAASSDLNDPGFIELAESNPASFIFSAGRNVVIDSTLMLGSGDFVASAGTRAHLPSDFPLAVADANLVVRSHEGPGIYAKAIDTNGKIIFRSAHFIDTPILESGANGAGGYIGYYTDGSVVLPHYANSNGHFEVFNYTGAENLISIFQLSDGSMIELPSIVSFESSDAGYVGWYGSNAETTLATSGGNFYIEAREIQHWGGNAVDVSFSSGHGNISLIAEEEVTPPPIIYSNTLGQGAAQSSEIRLSGNKIRIDRDIDFNNAGVVDFRLDASGDVIIGVNKDDAHYLERPLLERRVGGSIFDSVGEDADQLNLQITSGGTVFQKYDLFTGGGNYSATASGFEFNDLITLNTDFSNETQDALFGTGNVSIQSISDETDLVLPGITTQTDCMEIIACGTLNISAESATNKGSLRIFGAADFSVNGALQLKRAAVLESGDSIALENAFEGTLSVNSAYADLSLNKSVVLGEWNLTSTSEASVIAMPGYDGDFDIVGNQPLNVAGTLFLGGSAVELKNTDTRIAQLQLSTNRANIEYSGDLELRSSYLFGDESGETSYFKVGGDLNLLEDGYITGGFLQSLPILDVDPAAPIIFDVAGNIQLLGERNRLSSIQILNAQNVEIFNNGQLTLDGVNAESLTLNVLGDIEQTAALNILGNININASAGANINLLDPLNDFNSLTVQGVGPAIINIANANNIVLADINLNGASQGGALSVRAAAITQEENGRILLQDGTRLNLQADYITLGANGSATVDIYGSTLNGVFTRDLNIQGAVRGGEGVAGTGVAGFYFNGSVEDNFFEVAEGASITGDFISGSKIHLGDGNDTASLAGDVAIPIEGGAGQDTFLIAAPNLSIAQILGNEGQDILVGPDANNVWVVTANGEGGLSHELAVSSFDGIETIRGGSQTDDFIVGPLTAALQIDGGGGVDSLSANLTDASTNNQWMIDGVNSGSLNEFLLFTSIENLIGNDGADTVTFAEGAQIGDVSTGLGDDIFTLAADVTTGLLDAGDGQDTLNLNGLNSIYTYLNELIGGDGSYTTSGFEIENNEGGSKAIVGVNGYDAEWVIDGDGSVTISALQGGTTETNRFTGVTRMEGASGDDTFILLAGGQLADQIVGGQGGVDTLRADNGQNNNWLISGANSGQLNAETDNTSLLFQGIANLIGGSNDDVFEIATGGSINGSILGGSGNNHLTISDASTTNTWRIGATNLLESELGGAQFFALEFAEIQTLIGSEGKDTLILPESGQVDLLNSTANEYSVELMDHYISIGGTIDGTDFDSTWILNQEGSISFTDASESDEIINFSNFTTFRGGLGRDEFIVQGSWENDDVWVYGSQVPSAIVEGDDSFHIDIDAANASWYFSTNPVNVYLNGIDNSDLVNLPRDEVQRALLESTANVFNLVGIKSFVGGSGSDAFFVLGDSAIYGDSDLFDPIIDGAGGENFLTGFNYGAPEDLVWSVTEDFGGRLNDGAFFRNFAHLKSNEFLDLNSYQDLRSTFIVADGVRIGTLTADSKGSQFNLGTESIVDAIIGGAGTDIVNAPNFANVWQLNATGGSLNGSDFADIEILNGGTASDAFILLSDVIQAASIDGGSGENSLTAFNQENTWNLGASASTLNGELQFTNITNLIGGAGADVFSIAETVPALNIDGGAGTNTLIANRDNTLSNTWSIGGVNSGALNTAVQFSNIQDLQGNDGVDTFTFADNSVIGNINASAGDDIFVLANNITAGILDGGEGTDTLNLNGMNSIYTYLNELIGGDGNYTASGFEIEINEGGSKTIVGVDGYGAEWVVDGDGSIEVTARQDDVTVVNRFSGVTRLQGASGSDTFILQDGYIAGGIVGSQDGADTLVADTGVQNDWSLDGVNAGTVSAVGSEREQLFEAITNLVGGSDNDVFNILSGADFDGTISGGGGENSLAVLDPSASSVWTIASTNDVRIQSMADIVSQITFSDIQSLIGNANEDVLDLSAVAGSVDLAQQMATGSAVPNFSIQGFDTFISNGGGFLGSNSNSTWILNELSEVAYEDQSGIAHQLKFSGFQNVYGGTGEDYFRIDGLWFADAGAIYAGTLSESLDAAELNISGTSAWSFNSNDSTAVYTDIVDPDVLFSATRTEALNTLADSSSGAFYLSGIERNLGGDGDDVFFGYGDSDLFNPYIDGRGGNDYLLAYNWGTPEDLVWNITEDFGGNINEAVVFRNIENLKSHDFFGSTENPRASYFNVANGVSITTLVGDTSNTTFNIGSGALVGTILDNGGVDTINVSNGTNTWLLEESGGSLNSTTFAGIEILNGGSGSDEFIITSPATQVTQINGGEGSNSLTAFDQDNSWTLSATGGTLNDSLQFTDIAGLIGGAGVDTFFVDDDSVAVGLDGGLGSNQLIASGIADNTWLIDGANAGSLNSVMTFERIENLDGGAGNDTFIFTANSTIGNINAGAGDDTFVLANNITAGILDGGEGQDTLDRGGINTIITYLREVIGGDALYTTANVEAETSAGGSTTVVAVDGYDARWLINGEGSVSVLVTDEAGVAQTNTFADVTRLQGGSGVDEFVLQAGGAIADGIQGSGDDSLIASDTTNTWTISSENAGELVVAEGPTLVFQGIADLIGGSGADLFNIVAGGSVTGLIDGGAGADHLVVSDSNPANFWQLGAQNSVNSVARFQRVEAVTGNAGDDRFIFDAATDVTSIDGNTGSNALLWNAGDLMVNLAIGSLNDAIQFSAIRVLEADATATNTVIGADIDNVWTLDGAATGTVANAESTVSFIGFQNLVGGAAGDEFTLTADAAGLTSFNGMAGADTITAADQANQWLLDAEGGELNGLRFANVEAVVGGAFADDFVLVDAISQAQSVDGGAGANRLTGFDQANTWDVTSDNSGSVTGLASFSNIQTLLGGAEADTFTLAAGVNLSEIYGGAGNDTFVIGEGVVADNLFGDAGDDSFDVDIGLVLSGVLDGGSGDEIDGDYINLSKYTVLDATADLETVLGFAFRNFERIDEPNNQGVYFGGNGTNFWYITGANEGRLEIRDGDNAGVYEFTGVHSLLGGEGEDIFIFANDSAAVSTLIDGGEGAGANTLDLSAQGLINEWLLSGANSGTVSNTSNTSGNVFTNIAYLIGGSNRDIFELRAGGSIAGAIDGGLGADELSVAVEQTSRWQLGGSGGHSVTGIASFTNIATLTGSAGNDIFDVLAELTDVTQLNGGAGSDAVNFLYEAPVNVDLAKGLAGGLRVEAIEQFIAADARSTFTGVESAATWTLDGTNQGAIEYLMETGGNPVNVAFNGFGNLTGGAGDDQFIVRQGGSVSGTLSGGDGRNTVDLQGLSSDIHVAVTPEVAIADGLEQLTLTDMDQLIGNGRTWLYGASDRSYTWTIDGARSGQMTSTLIDDNNRMLAFENLSAIRGGAHDDIFRVSAAAPLISLDGGAAVNADLVDYSQVNGNLRINLADALGGQNGVIAAVEGIRGNNAGADSLHSAELVGPDGGATWSIGNVNGDGLADGINDGEVVFGDQTITFIDFNVLTGGAGIDVFNQTTGVILGTLNGGAGDDIFNVGVSGTNAGTRLVGGAGNDSLFLRGGDAAGLMTYTANADGGEFDYSLADIHYKVSHQEVENLNDSTLAEALDIRGSNAAETFSLANGRFWVNGGNAIQYSNKRDIAVRSGINDTIEIADNLVVDNALTLANGTVIANDPANSSITATDLILDSTRDVGLSSARLRTSIDHLWLRNSAGDTYLQEQNGLNLAEFSSNGVFDLLLLNGNLTNSAPVLASDVFRVVASNGDITLSGANQLRDDVALTGNRVELHNASTLTLVEVNAEDLYLRTQRGIEGDGPLTVSGMTDIDAGGDVLLDFATNDFNRVRVTNAVNLTLVDQNAIELLDINASGTVVVRSTNSVTLNDSVTGANGVDVSSDIGSVDQNGSITTNSGAVVVSAGNGEVNLGEDARIVSNGGSVSINAGAGNVNMGGDTRIAANGGDVNIIAADSVVVAEVISSGNVSINAGSGSVSDGNGGATNVSAGGLQSSSNTGFGSDDALETNVGSIDITTNTGNVAVSNNGNVAVDNVSTGQGDVSLVNQGNVELGGGSVVAENGANGGSVNIDVSKGSVSQSGSTSVPAVKGGGVVVINAPDGAIGEGGGLRVDAPFVEIIAAIKAGDIFVNPGADKIEYFSGSFKFDDQLLAVEPLEDINPAIFANVKSYFFNDISLLLPRDQLYDEDDEE